MSPGRLHVVAVPIGNPGDITCRAVDALRSADVVLCEERREGSTLLKRLGLVKELRLINEHCERSAVAGIVEELRQGKIFALISDCGTPVFSDPGHELIRAAAAAGVRVTTAPGPSSLMAALSLCDFKIERFIYDGFLPRRPEERRRRLEQLRGAGMPVALMDTPYRMTDLLEDVGRVFGPNRRVILTRDLTMPSEMVHRGPVAEVLAKVRGTKSEFVLIIAPPFRKGEREKR